VIWYAAYGSNLDRDRFALYLGGGRPPGGARSLPGARDASPPRDERAVVLPGSMFFGWRSPTWGGGVSFYDADGHPEAPEGDSCLARAYLLTEGQFADVAAQEMHREPGEDVDLAHVLEHKRDSLGPGRYETLHLVGELDGIAMLTFTADDPAALPANPPTPAYLATLVRGLRDTHDLDDRALADYLLARPGLGGWTGEDLTAALEPAG
jgi:hypothetical protein